MKTYQKFRLIQERKDSYSLFFFIAFLLFFYSLPAGASPSLGFVEVTIKPQFKEILTTNQEFMSQSGAELIETESGNLALIGIGKVFPEDSPDETEPRLIRMGEIRARAAILELTGDIEVQTSRGAVATFSSEKKTSLSAFFQITATKVEDKVKHLPVIGTWWSKGKNILYVAVGTWAKATREKASEFQVAAEPEPTGVTLYNLEGEEPYVSLIKSSPLLRKGNSVQGFVLPDGRKVLVSVGSVPIKEDAAKAIRMAQLKAIRELAGLKNGLQVSSAKYLADQESLKITKEGEQHVMLSEFLSVQEEQVYGKIKALPIVATWTDEVGEMMFVGIGKYYICGAIDE